MKISLERSRRIKIAPSILSADFAHLNEEIKKVEVAGADLLHVDVMDGHFVPNITIGPNVIKDIRKITKLPLDVHLMIENPRFYVDKFIDAGSDMITVHVETVSLADIKFISQRVKSKHLKFGLSLNPATPVKKLTPFLKYADFILIMSVNPGFGGQAFIPSAISKIRSLRKIFNQDISVDGGINEQTAKLVILAGANILAAGSFIFKAKDKKTTIERLRCIKR